MAVNLTLTVATESGPALAAIPASLKFNMAFGSAPFSQVLPVFVSTPTVMTVLLFAYRPAALQVDVLGHFGRQGAGEWMALS